MTKYATTPPALVTLPVVGSDAVVPVGNVYCVGRNYADHAVEMGHDPDREPPFFFIKPAFAVLPAGGAVRYPALTQDLHHEVELVVVIGKGGQNITVEAAPSHVFGFGVGIDFTRRDLQAEAKALSRPWEAGKTFLHAAPCSAVMPCSDGALRQEGEITLSVNGDVRQRGNLNQMIWKIPEVISRLSELFYLQAGDLIFTGTPAGVGPVVIGDTIVVSVTGVGEMGIDIIA